MQITPTQAKSLSHSLEQAAGDNTLYVNTNNIEYKCFNQEGAISTLDGSPLKLVDTYLGRSISSMENNVGIGLEKAWTAINRLSM